MGRDVIASILRGQSYHPFAARGCEHEAVVVGHLSIRVRTALGTKEFELVSVTGLPNPPCPSSKLPPLIDPVPLLAGFYEEPGLQCMKAKPEILPFIRLHLVVTPVDLFPGHRSDVQWLRTSPLPDVVHFAEVLSVTLLTLC